MGVDLSEAEENRRRLREQHRELGEKPRHDVDYQEAVSALLRTTVDLLDSEGRAVKAAEEERRRERAKTIRVISAATAGVAAFLLLSAAVGWIGRWWLPMVAAGLVALADLRAEPRRPVGGQGLRLLRAAVLGVAAVAAVLVAFGALPGWCAVIVGLVLFGVVVSGGAGAPTSSASGPTPREERHGD
ncbi:hypothetical protein [Parafrankia sp. EUN1f]|uniref:hypothetical protein n=1 Tax=Parafrankia sp. EUN1f TaxID=102897 RepID=UPI0001C45EC6|nr:hypothetical protein [Parafrankia sp. EUN1f]EFC81945.1 hypothetical protein FrEUN1fDRAFT_4960 [Parafrankia sp. EUN1f]